MQTAFALAVVPCKLLPLNLHPSPTIRRQQFGGRIRCLKNSSSVDFPKDYNEVLQQLKIATYAALQDSKTLLEIEFPTAGLGSVSGDAEGGIEMNNSLQLVREFCEGLLDMVRIFFPDVLEFQSAKEGLLQGISFKLDYLTIPSRLEDIGFSKKVKFLDHVRPADRLSVAAYPHFNANEMLVVEELYKDVAKNNSYPIVVFNGELDRIRSGYYPPFFYPKLGALSTNFLPLFKTVYYVHNFKGYPGGTLFRVYPGPWQVPGVVNNRLICLHEQEQMPSLKEVALSILPNLRT